MNMNDINTNDIDMLVMLTQQQKALEAEIKRLKDEVANKYGEGTHAGTVHRINVALSQRKVVAWAKVAEQANVPQSIVDANTSVTSIITVKTV